MTTKSKTRCTKKIDYREKMRETLRNLLDLLNVSEIQNWFKGIANLMRFGRNYSPNNLLLVQAQKREAIWTEGFYTWKMKYRRSIRKGEKGILIFAPVPVKPGKKDNPQKVESSDPEKTKDTPFVLFRPVFVWDYAQTHGDQVPAIESMLEKRNAAKKELYGATGENLQILSETMVELVVEKGLEIQYRDLGSAAGMASGKTIFIDSALDVGNDLDVLIHEYAHILLGHLTNKGSQSDHELEAELTVGLVKAGLNIDIQVQAAYLYTWSRDEEIDQREERFMKAFNASQPLANEILNHLSPVIAAGDEAPEGDIAA